MSGLQLALKLKYDKSIQTHINPPNRRFNQLTFLATGLSLHVPGIKLPSTNFNDDHF